MRYPIVIHKDSVSDYGVIVPDLPGCFSAGGTYEEALENAREAIECHVAGLILDNELIPAAKQVDDYIHLPEYEDGVWAFV